MRMSLPDRPERVAPEPIARVPTLLVHGGTAPARLARIARMLAGRPAGARWAVQLGLPRPLASAGLPGEGQGVFVGRSMVCPCCLGGLGLRTALKALLRRARPHRLIVESVHPGRIGLAREALGHPEFDGILDLQQVLDLDAEGAQPAS
jgi:hypothetical protein